MKWILISTLSVLFLVILVTFIIIIKTKKHLNTDNNVFLNSEGNHVYYDKSMIEKKEFMRKHPEITDVRTIKRLFRLIIKRKE